MERKVKHSYVAIVAARLRMTREAFAMEQHEFADKAGIARNTYNQYEQGQRLPRLDIAVKLCEVYDLTLDWIFRGKLGGLPFNTARTLQSKVGIGMAELSQSRC
jgi:DNA-binding XRE family transcriptional regulator